ncbi:MAG: acyltransferase family protein [Romboutsia sp.]
MSVKEKNYFIDNLKVLLIFLVVFGHLIERYIDTNNTLMGIYMFIYTFHMPLFIFISGFLSKNVNKSKKVFFRSLLLPYIVLNIIWSILAYLYTKDTIIPILYPGWTLWFLLSLFFWRISLKYLIKIKFILPISFILGVLAGFIPNGSILSISRTFVFLPFFLLGYYADINKLKDILDRGNIKLSIIGVIFFVLCILTLAENNVIDYKFLYGSYSYSELGLSVLQGILYRIILYISSILLSVFICQATTTKKNYFTHMGKSTMYVYTFHIYIVLLVFYILPIWDKSIFTNWIILLSPLFITYILSRDFFGKAYNYIFNHIARFIKL